MDKEIETLINKLDVIKNSLTTGTITKNNALQELSQLLKEYNNLNSTELEDWKKSFLEFLGIKEVQRQLRELFFGYLESENANIKSNRANKAYIYNQIEELLLILNKA